MSILKTPTDVFIVGSILYNINEISKDEIIETFESKFGKSSQFYSEVCPMKEYYSSEMGAVENLQRFFLFSENLFPRNILVPAKQWAIEFENKNSTDHKRKVNCDIGILSIENFQLATGKNFTHRVFIDKNIYSDLTLIYQNNSFQKLPWTYADYGSTEVIDFLNYIRRILQTTLDLKDS